MARLPLEDVKILDFMWVMAGPAGTRMLADYGAGDRAHESPTRIDTARTFAPYHNNQIGPDASGLFSNCNAGKFGLTLDIGNPRSREVIRDLVNGPTWSPSRSLPRRCARGGWTIRRLAKSNLTSSC